MPFPIPSSQLVPRMIAKRSFPAPGWVPGLPGLPGLPVGSQDGHPYIRYGNSACRWLHLSVDHMTIGKELLVSNLLTTLLWCQAANVLVESSYSFLDSLHQYACPFSTEFCDDLHLGTVLIHETSYNNRNQWYCNTVATTEEQVHLIRTTTAVVSTRSKYILYSTEMKSTCRSGAHRVSADG